MSGDTKLIVQFRDQQDANDGETKQLELKLEIKYSG